MTSFDPVAFGKRITNLRRNKNYSQEELAAEMHISGRFLSKMETGQAAPSLDVVLEFSEVFSVSLDYLIKGDTGIPAPVVSEIDSAIFAMQDVILHLRQLKNE